MTTLSLILIVVVILTCILLNNISGGIVRHGAGGTHGSGCGGGEVIVRPRILARVADGVTRILRLFKIYFNKVDGMFSLRLNGVVRGYILRS